LAGDHGSGGGSEIAAQMKDLVEIWSGLGDFGTRQKALLAASAGLIGGVEVPLVEWMDRFPTSPGASADAFCTFVGCDLPDHPDLTNLAAERRQFVETQGWDPKTVLDPYPAVMAWLDRRASPPAADEDGTRAAHAGFSPSPTD